MDNPAQLRLGHLLEGQEGIPRHIEQVTEQVDTGGRFRENFSVKGKQLDRMIEVVIRLVSDDEDAEVENNNQ